MSAVLSPILWAWFGEQVVTGGKNEETIPERMAVHSGTEG